MKRLVAISAAIALTTAAPVLHAGKGGTPNGRPFQQINAQLDAHQALLDAHQAILDIHSMQIADLEGTTQALLADVAAIEAVLADHEARIQGNTSAIDGLLLDVTAIENAIAANSMRIDQNMTRLDGLEGEVDDFKAQVDADLATIEGDLARNRAELEGLLAQLESRVSANEADTAALRLDLIAAVSGLQQQIDALNALIQQVRSEIPSNADIETLIATNSVVTGLLADVAALSSAQTTLSTRLSTLEGDFDAEIEALRELIASLPTGGSAGGITDLAAFAQRVSSEAASIRAGVPSNFVFNYEGSRCYIGDGGRDMYDAGNQLNTNLLVSQRSFNGPCLAYTDGQIRTESPLAPGVRPFGPDSSYVTLSLPGLFVMAATDMDIQRFFTTGNNGADNQGGVTDRILDVTVGGQRYTVFAKLVSDRQNTRDPSINQLIVIPGDGAGIAHSFAAGTDDGFHEVSGLSGVDSMVYILTATWNPSTVLSDASIIQLVTNVLD